jgi:anti-sigma regulatory factor (Ser/Thr protein kinase)
MTIVLTNHMDELSRLTDAVAGFVAEQRISGRDGFELTLVLEEIFTNIVSYGFDEPGAHAIEVSLERRDGVVHVDVADAGRPFDPRDVPPPDLAADLEHPPIGGHGIHLVRRLTEDLAYERRAGINHLSFRKTLSQADGD